MHDKKRGSSLLLALTALIWGMAFVAQQVGMDYVGPFTFNAVRFLIGAAALLPVVAWSSRGVTYTPESRRSLLAGGLCCGAALCAASSLQQVGIAHTTVGKAGFITALYIVIVPLLRLLGGRRPPAVLWVSVALAAAGMYLLCITEGFSIGGGDLLILGSAAVFSVHILLIDHFAPRVDGVALSCAQFFVSGCLCAVGMAWERPAFSALLSAWAPVLYAGVLSCGVAYTLQVVAQKNTDPTVASLILSLESVFALLAGWVLLGQALSLRELLGSALVFGAILLAQLPGKKREGGARAAAAPCKTGGKLL